MAANDWLNDELDIAARQAADIKDLEAVLDEMGFFEHLEGEDEPCLMVETWDGASVETVTTRVPLRSIHERVQGDPVEAMKLAEWCLSKRREQLEWQAQVDATAEARIAEIKQWQEDSQKKVDHKVGFFDYLLQGYRFDFHPEKEGTIKLAGGELRRDKQRDRTEWDEAAALEWALVQSVPEELLAIKKQAIKDRLKEDGEQVEFIAKVPPEEPYKLSVKQEVG